MRKMGISGLVLLCLLATAPVMAAEGGLAGSWWDGVVEWVTGMVAWVTIEMGPDGEPVGLVQGEAGIPDHGDMGPGVEPDGLSIQGSDPNS